MTWRRVVVIGLGTLLLLNACASDARSRQGRAVVTGVASGAPCFSIEDTSATRGGNPRLRALSVYAESGPDTGKIWSYLVQPDSQGVPIQRSSCSAYGQMPADAQVLQQPSELIPGILYSVEMNVKLDDPTNPTFMYVAEFCLILQPDRTIRVHQVRWDKAAGKWQRDICLGK